MKRLVVGLLLVTSSLAFASEKNCKLYNNFANYTDKDDLSSGEDQIVESALIEKGFTITKIKSEADYILNGALLCGERGDKILNAVKFECVSVIAFLSKDRDWRGARMQDIETSKEKLLVAVSRNIVTCEKLEDNLQRIYGK